MNVISLKHGLETSKCMGLEQWQFNFGIENYIRHRKQNVALRICIGKSCIGAEK